MARPRKAPEDVRHASVKLRFSQHEKQELTEFAKAKGQALAVWARTELLAAVRLREPDRHPKKDEQPEPSDAFCMVVPICGERVEVRLRPLSD